MKVVKKEQEKTGNKGHVRQAINPVKPLKMTISENVLLEEMSYPYDSQSLDEDELENEDENEDLDQSSQDSSLISNYNDFNEKEKIEMKDSLKTNGNLFERENVLERNPEAVARLKCTFCQSEEQSYKFLKKHVENIHQGLRYMCSLCDFNSQEQDKSRQHMEKTHMKTSPDNLKFECGICKFQGKLLEHSDHIIMIHPEYCHFLFDDVDEELTVVEQKFAPLSGEMKVEEDDGGRWPCTVCGFRAASKHGLKVHVEMNHLDLRFSCNVCSFNSKECHILRGHVVKVHNDDRNTYKHLDYWCGLCQFKGLKDEFMEHINLKHPDLSVYFDKSERANEAKEHKNKGICSFCQQKLTCNLRGHIQTIHFGVNYTCKDKGCSHSSKMKDATIKHIEMKHLPLEYNVEDKVGAHKEACLAEGRAWVKKNCVFKCGHCGIYLERHAELAVHMTTEHHEKIAIKRKVHRYLQNRVPSPLEPIINSKLYPNIRIKRIG